MAVIYRCRHCGDKIGELQQSYVHEEDLGLHILSNEERNEMIDYTKDGHMEVKAICDHCEDALNNHPDYHELDSFIQ
ncbi:anti-sigma-F factor Fin family protein [Virgibacillus sp. MSP4-1]|uniref:anti-sigma-F factor Fin family protein n=1 Tax=Virgibacillus sp. MSP4-1 TaxID=2700081 RepID=UPI0003A7593A|nr:anti-sigma-F factor Fin family protein [Virgibacillus sp. MSP4-1]QHS23889.1 anti-sigma-F factor Fin family protein [Virgibacillus sp. MSP4-1]